MKLVKSPAPLTPYNQGIQKSARYMDAFAYNTYEMAVVLHRLTTVGKRFEPTDNPHDANDPAAVHVEVLQASEDPRVQALLAVTYAADRALETLKEYWSTTDASEDLIPAP